MTAFNPLQCLYGGGAEVGVDTGFGTRACCLKEASGAQMESIEH